MPNASSNNNHPPTTYELLTQLSAGPTSREVASATLRTALREQYPTLNIDPDLAMVVTPRWRIVNDLIQPAAALADSLTTVLARQILDPTPVIYIDGEHFLTLQPGARPPVHLPVKIDAIARLLNELSDLMLIAFQEQYLDYWNAPNGTAGPHWQAFSQSLRKVWNISTHEGWDEHDCAMARTLYRFPDPAKRPAQDPYKTRAYLIDVDTQPVGEPTHIGITDMMVLIGEHEQQTRILVYSLVNGYEKFDSLEQLGEQIPGRLNKWQPNMKMQWRLYEPIANLFDSLACALIDLQLEAIETLDADDTSPTAGETDPGVAAVRVLPVVEDLSDHSLSNIRSIHQQLPDWLNNASDLDISAYSRYLINLAQLHTHQEGQAFDDGIAPIHDYAREQLQSAMREHANGTSLNVDKIEIVIKSPVVWGTFVLPGSDDITRRNLIDLTLENLTGLPTGDISVNYNGSSAPDWLTYSYLKTLIERIDVGEHYPALIKRTLLDDPTQSAARQLLYSAHLRLQLPLLALQMKIRNENGLDERGYRYVAAVMKTEAHDRQVDGQAIVLRQLAFIPTLRPGHEQDVVANMFVISPRDLDAGPCLLYRPLLEPTLLQFPSQQNLIYFIKHRRDLRDSVLAWLPEPVRFNYSQYVFPSKWPSPWTVARALIESQVVEYMSGPIVLSQDVMGNDTLATLFKANANAMVELASRQSVSNVQKRWATYRQTGWQIFNAVLPFLGRTVNVAAWIWQIMDDLEEAGQAADTAATQEPWTAQVDLLLNLGMALVLHVALRHPTAQEPIKSEPPEPKLPEPELPLIEETEQELPIAPKGSVKQLPNITGNALPARHEGPMNTHGVLPRGASNLAVTLERFKTTKPAGLGEQVKTPGAHRHLYPDANKWYAVVGERWFEVRLDEGDNVLVIDPNDASRTGPILISNLAGQWFVDTRLRLRGGGLKSQQRASRQRLSPRILELRKKLAEFDADEKRKQLQVIAAQAEIGPQPGPSTDLRQQAFLNKVDHRLTEYDVPIRQLRSLSIIDTVPNYQSAMIGYLSKQLLLTRTAVDERLPLFQNKLTLTLKTIERTAARDPKRQADSALAMSDFIQEMIKRMEYAETRYRELEKLGAEGMKVIQTTITALPDAKIHDLKAMQITLARYLCIKQGAGEAFVETRGLIHDIVDDADVNVQNCVEILVEVSINSLDERIEVLNSLVDQFAIVDQRLLDLHAGYPEQVLREPLEALRQKLDDFNQKAVRELASLLREQKALAPKPGPSKAAQTPKKKVINTRFNGVVVGKPREAEAGLVDVIAPVTGKVIATFHEKTPGVWVERDRHAATPQPASSTDLGISLNAGQAILDGEPTATQRTLAHSKKPGRIPVEIEEMFHQYAARLERAAGTIETALTRQNLTESDRPSAATLNKQLNDNAQRLYELGTSTRISMTKQQPPTAARVEWLHNQKLVKITKVVSRRRLKGPGKNYLDEYEIRDPQTHTVLWYAHFHYASPQAALEEYVAGHLKTREQQKLGGAFQQKNVTDREQIAIYRSEISLPLARSVFFAHEPPQASSTT